MAADPSYRYVEINGLVGESGGEDSAGLSFDASYDLGDVADLLEDLLPGGGNVLQLFISLDNRYVPIDLEAQRLARQRFHNWVWDPRDEFWPNIGRLQRCVKDMKEVGITGGEIPSKRDMRII